MWALIPKLQTGIKKLFDNSLFEYDKLTNTIIIKNSNLDKPLNIVFENDVKIGVDGDFEIQTNGQLDVMSHSNILCLDSLNSKIYLNSRRSKYCSSLVDIIKQHSLTPTSNSLTRSEYDSLSVELLYHKVCELEQRLITYIDKE